MATGNFCNHENGIFVVPRATIEEITKVFEEENIEITDESIYMEMGRSEVDFIEDFEYILESHLKGYSVIPKKNRDDEYILENKNGKIVAELSFQSGYYDGVQLIVGTDPDELGIYYETQSELYEQHSPNNKRLFKALSKIFIELEVSARFSNGETIYSKVS